MTCSCAKYVFFRGNTFEVSSKKNIGKLCTQKRGTPFLRECFTIAISRSIVKRTRWSYYINLLKKRSSIKRYMKTFNF